MGYKVLKIFNVLSSFLNLAVLLFCSCANAQMREKIIFKNSVVVDGGCFYGLSFQKLATLNGNKYPQEVNNVLNYKNKINGTTLGMDYEIGVYFGEKKVIGLGVGLIEAVNSLKFSIDSFHVEYRAVDEQNIVFRQLVSSVGSINESVRQTTLKVPLLLKWKIINKTKFQFYSDFGLLFIFNSNFNYYNSSAYFNYEAIYSYIKDNAGFYVNTFDAYPVLRDSAVYYTKNNYPNNTYGSNASAIFDSFAKRGYNIGLNIKPDNNTGNIIVNRFAIGVIIKPKITFKLFNQLQGYIGGFFYWENYKVNSDNNYKLIQSKGIIYSSLLNSSNSISSFNTSINVGMIYTFSNKI